LARPVTWLGPDEFPQLDLHIDASWLGQTPDSQGLSPTGKAFVDNGWLTLDKLQRLSNGVLIIQKTIAPSEVEKSQTELRQSLSERRVVSDLHGGHNVSTAFAVFN